MVLLKTLFRGVTIFCHTVNQGAICVFYNRHETMAYHVHNPVSNLCRYVSERYLTVLRAEGFNTAVQRENIDAESKLPAGLRANIRFDQFAHYRNDAVSVRT